MTTKKISVSPVNEEPNQASAKPEGAKPAKREIARDAVVGTGETDTIRYSSAKPSRLRKVLTVLHLQRRLAQEGFPEANSAPGGSYETLTTSAVRKYQESIEAAPTGVLTRDQFSELFHDDPNVTVVIDTHEDHQV